MTDNLIGNVSTIVKTILLMISGWAIGYAVSIGLDLPIDATQLSEILFTIICFIVAYIDAKFPNSFKRLGNYKPPITYPQGEVVLNDEYETIEEEEGC